jgi:hypothetical protein
MRMWRELGGSKEQERPHGLYNAWVDACFCSEDHGLSEGEQAREAAVGGEGALLRCGGPRVGRVERGDDKWAKNDEGRDEVVGGGLGAGVVVAFTGALSKYPARSHPRRVALKPLWNPELCLPPPQLLAERADEETPPGLTPFSPQPTEEPPAFSRGEGF